MNEHLKESPAQGSPPRLDSVRGDREGADGATGPELISVVLPVFKEADNIHPCLRGLWHALQHVEHEILVCYDFEEDPTLPAIAAMPDRPPSVRLVKNDFGRGAANAIRAGFAAARGDVIVTTMADLCDPPEIILDLARELRQSQAAIVSGSRYMPGGSQRGGPFLKRMFSRYSSLILRALSGIGTHDATNNFRAFDPQFLAKTTIETRQAFDIGLELTVKAHLAGRRVSEVPTSWVDRQAGASQFRMWSWMPMYLRWWTRALAAPAVVWSLWLGLWLWSWFGPRFVGDPATTHAGGHRGVATMLAAAAAASILLVRSIRGRTRYVDALLALCWLHPWQASWLGSKDWPSRLALLSAAGGALVPVLAGLANTRAWIGAFVRARGAKGLVLGALAAVFALAVWLTNFSMAEVEPLIELDPSWRRAYSYFFERGFRAGVDYAFTYGPIGFVEYGTFSPSLYWTELLAYEVPIKALCAVVLAWTFVRIPHWIERLVFAAVVLAFAPGIDAYLMVICICITALLLQRPQASLLGLLPGLLLLWTLGMVKFSVFLVAGVSCVFLAFDAAVRLGLRQGLKTMALAAAAVLAVWTAIGQRPLDIVPYVRKALEVADGYDDAMSFGGALSRQVLGAVLLSLLALSLAWDWFRAGRGLAALAWLGSAGLATYLSWKAGFVRHGGSLNFFYPCAVLFLVGGLQYRRRSLERKPGAGVAVERAVSWARATCACAALWTIPAVEHNGLKAFTWLWSDQIPAAKFTVERLVDADDHLHNRTLVYDHFREQAALRKVKQYVGDHTIDIVPELAALAIVSDLNWKPRPIFQSYSAYTPKLAELNRRHFLGDNAPQFVLSGYSYLDGRLPQMDDQPLHLELVRAYQPVLVEAALLLLERKPDIPAPPRRTVLLEKDLAVGEFLSLEEFDAPALMVRLDVQPSVLGRLRTLLFGASTVRVETKGAGDGTWRIIPDLVRDGVLIRPWMVSSADLLHMFAGLEHPRVQALRVVLRDDQRIWFQSKVTASVESLEGWLPAPDAGLLPRVLERSFDRAQPGDMDGTIEDMLSEPGCVPVEAFESGHSLAVTLAPGRWIVRGKHGFQSKLRHPPSASRPLNMRLEAVSGGEREALLEARWDLSRRFDSREPEAFQVLWNSEQTAQLVFSALDDAGQTHLEGRWEELRFFRVEDEQPQ